MPTERRATIVQKHKNHFTVELIPEEKEGRRGQYRLAFQYVDLIIGRVKILGVDK